MLAALMADRMVSSSTIWLIAELTHVFPSSVHVSVHDIPDAPSLNQRDCSSALEKMGEQLSAALEMFPEKPADKPRQPRCTPGGASCSSPYSHLQSVTCVLPAADEDPGGHALQLPSAEP